MEQYIHQYILPLPTTGPKKRRKRSRKLATFTHKSSTKQENKSREKELNNIAKNAMEILQAHGITAQTSPYPLAISDIHGNARSSPKSQFLTTLTQCIKFDQAVSNTCPLILNPTQDLVVVIDLLYFLHMPPPPTVLTFSDYFDHLWRQTISRYSIRHNASHVYLVIDKPDFLPPPRSLVHQSRASKSDQDTRPDPIIEDDQIIPHNKTYTSLLSKSNSFKRKLILVFIKQILIPVSYRNCTVWILCHYRFTVSLFASYCQQRKHNLYFFKRTWGSRLCYLASLY